MVSKSGKMAVDDPRIDDTEPLTDDEIKRLKRGSEWFAERGLEPPRPVGRPKAAVTKVPVKVRLDPDIIDKLKADGKGWQTRLNDTLRKALDL